MVVKYLTNINEENYIKNNLNFYRFCNILIYIIAYKDKIDLLKSLILKREEKIIEEKLLFFQRVKPLRNIPYYENSLYKEKKEMKMAIIINENKRIKDKNDKIKENQIKKIMNNIYYNITLIRNCITFTLILLIINMFCQIKSNILFNLFYFQNSSKITLKIKGIGESYIFGNEKIEDDNFNFTNINYLKF